MVDMYKTIAWDEIEHRAKVDPDMKLMDAVIEVMQVTENQMEREIDKMDNHLQKEEQCKGTIHLSEEMLRNTEQIVP